MTDPHPGPGHGQQGRDREPERAGDEEPGERECDNPQPDVEDHHLRDGSALRLRIGNAAGEVHDVRRAAHAEEGPDQPAHDAGGRRPEPTQSSSGFATEDQVDRIDAHEQAERQKGRVARQAEEQRDAQGEPEEREGHERQELTGVGLPPRVEAERQRRAEIEESSQREHKGQREDVDENRNRDRRGAEPRDAEYEVGGEDHEWHEQQRVVRRRHAGTGGHYSADRPGIQGASFDRRLLNGRPPGV
jgi:hypothetical protein